MVTCMRWHRVRGLAALALLTVWGVAAHASPDIQLIHRQRYAMGTVFEIAVYSPSVDVDKNAAVMERALDEVVRLDQVMSNYKTDSELSHVNRVAHDRTVVLSPDLYAVIEESLLYSRLSGGRFDITVAPLVDAWKRAMNGGAQPTSSEETRLRACVGYQKLELIPPNRVQFHSPCMCLDLGAIGKGYAVDRVAAILRSAGISSALIDAGGSTLYAIGAPPDKPGWAVQLRDPSSKVDPKVTLLDNSVSTSEQTPRDLLSKDLSGHIVDPSTGAPAGEVSAVSVVAPTATAADALSTTLLLLGPVRGKSVAAGLAGVSAVWVSPQGEVVKVSGVTPILVKGGANTTASAGTQ